MFMAQEKKLGFWQVFKSTFMSFIGVQKSEIRKRDFENGNPVHFVLMGLLLTVLFVVVVVVVVKIVLSQAGL